MNPYDFAHAYVSALAGDPDTAVIDFRAIHDTDKATAAIPMRGTLPQMWQAIQHYNALGYGIFATPAAMNGTGLKLADVHYIRAHYIDLDNLSAQQNYERAAAWTPSPSFAVVSSPGKYHVYWPVAPYTSNDHFELTQRKLRQLYDGDRTIIDPTRVMRLPGTMHLKGEPHMVTCHALGGYGQPLTIEALTSALAGVNVIDGGVGTRFDLGEPTMAAPSLDWLKHALLLVDPNQLDRGEWIALTSAIKQAGWTLTDADTLFALWAEWCARYNLNDVGENNKQWHSIRNTEIGWPTLVKRVPSLQAAVSFGQQAASMSIPMVNASPVGTPPMPEPAPLDCSGEYLTHLEQQEWFKGCTFVVKLGGILSPDGRSLNSSQFNGKYGGKYFIIDGEGKKTDEPWKAATRSTLWTIPKVDHVRFLPNRGHGEIIVDALGRKGVNLFQAPQIERLAGDPTPFLAHIAALLPEPGDQRILLDYLAHNVKFPGYKIPWAPVIQSTEGAGKGVLKKLMTHAMGRPYVYFPNAKELTNSGSQFNAWMRNKLFILADEIKVDDKRDLIEVLKPMISEEMIEMQGKGVDQDLEDNFSNWCFFTNYKDAVPVSRNGRRYAVFYSALQSKADLIARGMDQAYYVKLYDWLDGGGAAIVANYLFDYPIERGAVAMTAPETSSAAEAVLMSRSPIERVLADAVEDGVPGFKHGWVSTVAAVARVRGAQVVRGAVSPHVVGTVLESMGYVNSGRAMRAYFQETGTVDAMKGGGERATLYHFGEVGDVTVYGKMQGFD